MTEFSFTVRLKYRAGASIAGEDPDEARDRLADTLREAISDYFNPENTVIEIEPT